MAGFGQKPSPVDEIAGDTQADLGGGMARLGIPVASDLTIDAVAPERHATAAVPGGGAFGAAAEHVDFDHAPRGIFAV